MPKFNQNFKKLDFFGVEPKLFIDSHLKYQTNFGSMLSLLLFFIICTALWVYGNDMYYKQNPNSIFTEGSTNHPEKFKLTKENLNFCFGLQDENYVHFVDPQVYTVDLELNTIIKTQDEKGNDKMEFKSTKLKIRQCKKTDFGVAEDYFTNIPWLQDLFCLDNYELAEIEGDFGSPVFTDIEAKFYPCKNTTENNSHCKPQEEIDKKLNDNYYAIYVSDYVVNPKDFQKPFQTVGRNAYGVSSNKMFKHIDFFFRNIYIEDNTGIVIDTWTSKRGIQFSDQKELIKLQQQESGKFLQLLFRLEKVKYTKIFRTYLNLAQVLANVGGIMKLSIVIFFIIAQKVGDTFYHLNMVNSLYQFGYDTDKNSSKNQQSAQKNKQLHINSIFDILFSKCARKQQIKQQKQLLDFSIQKLGYHLNIKNILHKLMEIDKLKKLLLDQDQIKIFEYLSKPLIDDKIINKNCQVNNTQKSEKPIKQNTKLSKGQSQIASQTIIEEQLAKNPFNILDEDQRSPNQKEIEAYQAYQSIYLNKKKRKIDKKLLEIMDASLINKFSNKMNTSIPEQINNHLNSSKLIHLSANNIIDFNNNNINISIDNENNLNNSLTLEKKHSNFYQPAIKNTLQQTRQKSNEYQSNNNLLKSSQVEDSYRNIDHSGILDDSLFDLQSINQEVPNSNDINDNNQQDTNLRNIQQQNIHYSCNTDSINQDPHKITKYFKNKNTLRKYNSDEAHKQPDKYDTFI